MEGKDHKDGEQGEMLVSHKLVILGDVGVGKSSIAQR